MSETDRPTRSSPPRRTARRATIALSAAALVAGLAGAPPAAATGGGGAPPPPDLGWSSAQRVAVAASTTSDARVGVDTGGSATVVWSHAGQVLTAGRQAGGAWSAPGVLGQGTSPRLVVAPDGGAVAVWVSTSGGATTIAGARRAGGGWTPLTPLSVSGTTDPSPAMDMAGDGSVVLAFRCLGGSALQAWTAVLPAGGGAWVDVASHSGSPTDVATPSVGLSADGSGLLAWVENEAGVLVVRASARASDGSYDVPGALAPVGATAVTSVAVDVATDGAAAAAWATTVAGHSVVRGSVRTGGLWSEPRTVSWTDQESSRPDVAVAAGGVATVTWLTTSYGKVMTATSGQGGGAWSDVWKLDYYGGSPSTPDAAVAPDGTPLAAWVTNPGSAGGAARTGTGSAESTVAVATRDQRRPVNLAPPRMSSPVAVNRVVTCLRGSWTGIGPETWWAYWWLRDGAFIKDANARTYRPTVADLGHRLQCKEKAGNGDAYTYAYSKAVVVAAGAPPVNLRRPTSIGTPRVGRVLVCRAGTWSMRLTTVRVQWLRSGKVIRGATRSTYRLTSADRGRYASCRVIVARVAHRPGIAVSRPLRVR